ncbi:MAG TPA: glutamate racemase [Candidatus Nitrosotalea sp.]|nr:glutamate racemase [Candidatus Nitrosotalea sp.]
MGDSRPIGIFDSGVGGLTVLRAIRERMPAESTVYVADLLHFPYGPRPLDEVKGFAFDLIEYLNSRQVKLIVIACNSATAAALSQARERYDVPIVGVISPGAQTAVERTRGGLIGVICTEATLRAQAYVHAIKELDPMVRVFQKACPELVEIVEAGEADSPRAEASLRADLQELVEMGADTLVLGCTHYPLLKPALERVYPGAFEVVDSAQTTAEMVQRRLEHARMVADANSRADHQVLVTARPEHFQRVARSLFGEAEIDVREERIWP